MIDLVNHQAKNGFHQKLGQRQPILSVHRALIFNSLLLLTSFDASSSRSFVAYGYSDREILHALFDATGGDDWERGSDSWRDPDTSFCSWEGITCMEKDGEQHRVSSISLQNNNLKGEVPMTKLLQLPFLHELALGGNDITLPSDIMLQDTDDDGKNEIMSELRYLNLDDAHLYDLNGIFGSGENALVSMKHLKSLILGNCGLHGTFPGRILQFTELEELILDKNDLKGSLPSQLGLMNQLRIIDLSSNHFTGTIPNAIGQLANLEFLDLNANELEGYLTNRINKLSKLKHLNLMDNNLDGPILSLEKLSNLESVDFSNNDFTGYIPTDFLANIDPDTFLKIDLSGNQLTDLVPVKPFKNLKPGSFWIHDNLIEGIDFDLCDSPAAGGYGCNGILCPPGTYNSYGMVNQDSGGCMMCESSLYYGATECNAANKDNDSENSSSIDEDDFSHILEEDDFKSVDDDYLEESESDDESSDSSEYDDDDDFEWSKFDEDESTDTSEDDLILSINEGDDFDEQKSDESESTDISDDESSDSESQDESIDVRTVLLAFFSNCGGDAWTGNEGWGDDHLTVCAWEGIHCTSDNDEKTVDEIILPDNNIDGTIPDDMFKIPQLAKLNLAKNTVTVSLTNIGFAKNLVKLDLSSTDLMSLEGIAAAVNLVELDVDNIDIREPFPEEVTSLRQLERLSLNNNHLKDEIPEKIGHLKRLQYLSLSNNDMSGSIPDIWDSMNALETLNLSNNGFTSTIPTSLNKCKYLESLDLSRQTKGGLSGPLDDFVGLVNIKMLDLSYNQLTGTIPATFLKDSNVSKGIFLNANKLSGEVPILSNTNVDLGDNRFTSVALSYCETMETLYNDYGCDAVICPMGTFNSVGRRTKTSGSCRPCPMARYMGSTDCASNDGGFDFVMSEEDVLDKLYSTCGGPKWRKNDGWDDPSVPHCKRFGVTCSDTSLGLSVTSIVLSKNNLIGMPPTELFQLQRLETLSLSYNDISFDFSTIARAKNLRVLDLANTKVIDAKGIGSATSLVELRMNGNNDTYENLLEILTLVKLNELIINGNPDDGPAIETEMPAATGPLPTEIGNLTRLRVLSMKGMGITGEIPKAISNLKDLKVLQLSYNNLSGPIPQQLLAISGLTKVDLSHQSGKGLTGTLPDFAGNKELVYLDLSSNQLMGPIPPTFLETVNPALVKNIDLSNNKLMGFIDDPIVRIMSKASSSNILDLTGNRFDSIDEAACISNYSCDGIVCAFHTFNNRGRQETADDVCKPCPTAVSLGSKSCSAVNAPVQQPKTQSPTSHPTVEAVTTEKDILMKFFHKCNGRSWYHRYNWGKRDICSYTGVTCVKNQQSVEELQLGSNNIKCIPPFELFTLPNLKKLSLYGNLGVTVSFFGIENAKNLRELSLDYTNTRELAGIENIPKGIQRLSLTNCDLDGKFPTPLLELVNLEYLSLADNDFTGTLPQDLSKLISLHTFIVKNNQFSGNLDGIAFPTFVKMIDLSGNNLEGTIPITFLSDERRCLKCQYYIDLSNNLFTGKIPGTLARFEMLNIELGGNFFLGIDKKICHKVHWNDGNVFKFGCDALLCPKGYATPYGKQVSAKYPCKPCPEAKYYGDMRCFPEAMMISKTMTPLETEAESESEAETTAITTSGGSTWVMGCYLVSFAALGMIVSSFN